MNKHLKIIIVVLALAILGAGISIPVLASAQDLQTEETAAQAAIETEETMSSAAQEQAKSSKALAAAAVVGIVAAVGAIGMAFAISKAVEGTARQPEAGSKIQTMLMLGLVFIETAIIYALIVAIRIIFVL